MIRFMQTSPRGYQNTKRMDQHDPMSARPSVYPKKTREIQAELCSALGSKS
jgi:hypothetical protein